MICTHSPAPICLDIVAGEVTDVETREIAAVPSSYSVGNNT